MGPAGSSIAHQQQAREDYEPVTTLERQPIGCFSYNAAKGEPTSWAAAAGYSDVSVLLMDRQRSKS